MACAGIIPARTATMRRSDGQISRDVVKRPVGKADDIRYKKMTDSTLETVLRRDRLVVAGALGGIIALAWGYVLWLAADMDMGGMDMTGFRMIPAGMGIMAPANASSAPASKVAGI